MRIITYIATPMFLLIGILVYMIYVQDQKDMAYWLIVPVVVLAILYISQSQLKWFFAKKNPPKMDERDRKVIKQHSLFYNSLDEEGRQKFEDRLSLILITRNIQLKHPKLDGIPHDLQLMMCMPLAQLTFDDDYFFEDDFQYLVFYPHPFLTPRNPDNVQIVEVEPNDGVIIYSMEQLLPGMARQSINLAAYSWAVAYMNYYAREYTVTEAEIQQALDKTLRVSYKKVQTYFNTEEINLAALLYALNYDFPKETADILPTKFLR